MKKRLLGLLALLMFVFITGSVFATTGVSYVSSRGSNTKTNELNVQLYPPEITMFTNPYSKFDYVNQIKFGKARDGFARLNTNKAISSQRSTAEIHVRNMPKITANEVYEAWLIDVDSGYQLSMGLFAVDGNGEGSLLWTASNYIGEYDKIAITKEANPDRDPSPSGNVLLVGDFDTTSLIKSSVSFGQDASKAVYADLGSSAPGYVKRSYAYSTH